jgi:iron complex outermembrane receptor protein
MPLGPGERLAGVRVADEIHELHQSGGLMLLSRTHIRTCRYSERYGIATTAASIVALLAAMPVAGAAKAADEAQTAQAPVEEIVVTGSRVVRNGYEAPTPVTVVGAEQLQDAAKPNIADALNMMPVFQGSTTPSTSGNGNGGTSGGNNLNLRSLGPNRTLVLFDGRRVPPSQANATVDINLLPDALVSRVDVVTGGASAVYGSDALAGVVNFVLDTKFQGMKGSVQGGVTARGDGRQYKVSLAGGTGFANDRGHVLLEADHDYQAAVDGTQRAWNMQGWYYIQNPARTATNGLPQFILASHVGLSMGYPGGIITSGPLKGVAFGPGGSPFQYNYGNVVSGNYHIGGDWATSSEQGAQSIMIGSNSTHIFARASYEITDNAEVYIQFNNGDVNSNARCCFVYHFGDLTVKSDNAFIPGAIQAQMTALKLTSLTMGMTETMNPHGFGMINERLANVYTIGAKGKFDAFETNWKWDLYAQRGITKQSFWVPFQDDKAKFANAIDAVRAPSGAIVCRSTLSNPTNGCVPWNLFGTGVVTQAAFDYAEDGPRLHQTIGQNIYGGSVTGEPFAMPAGPVSVAISGEYREDTIKGANDPISDVLGWFSTQLTGFNAKQHVLEGAVETLIPLVKDVAWAKSLDLNAAVRATNYSTEGYVTTWKAGLIYNPFDDLRIRATQSRDIRAPSLADLFSPPSVNHNTIPDPFKGNASFPYNQITQGNSGLQPEKADTTGLGLVYQPGWFHGFSVSVDYYTISAKGAIATPSFAYVLAQCFAGVTYYCTNVTRLSNGNLDGITTQAQNQAVQSAEGVDYEISYQTPLSDINSAWDGTFATRIVATNVLGRVTDSGIAGPTQILNSAGFNGGASTPRWGINASATLAIDPIRFTWTTRFVSRGRQLNTSIQCTSGCTTASGFNTVDNNYVSPYYLSNFTISYRFHQDGQSNAEFYLNVDNVFDKDPPVVPNQFAGATYGLGTNAALYDVMGRRFRAGVRFKV